MAITVETGGIPMAMESSRDQEAFSIPISEASQSGPPNSHGPSDSV